MSILFINGSPNKNGNTVKLAGALLEGKEMFFVFQGASPTKEQMAAGNYTVGRYAALYGMDYQGMVTNKTEAQKLAKRI